jgi:predicted transposase YdaD
MKHALEVWRDEYVGACVIEGKREGKREGEREKALKIAAGMKAEGMDVYTISRITELTIDEILHL